MSIAPDACGSACHSWDCYLMHAHSNAVAMFMQMRHRKTSSPCCTTSLTSSRQALLSYASLIDASRTYGKVCSQCMHMQLRVALLRQHVVPLTVAQTRPGSLSSLVCRVYDARRFTYWELSSSAETYRTQLHAQSSLSSGQES